MGFFGWMFGDADRCMGASRSGKWPEVRAAHLKDHPACAACGESKQLEVHHCLPFNVDAGKELDPGNLITLCEHHDCHLMIGHSGSFHAYNPHVREDARLMLIRVQSRKEMG